MPTGRQLGRLSPDREKTNLPGIIEKSSQELEVSIHGVFSTHLHTIFGQREIIIQVLEHFDIIPAVSILIGGSDAIPQGSYMGAKPLGSGLFDSVAVITPEPQVSISSRRILEEFRRHDVSIPLGQPSTGNSLRNLFETVRKLEPQALVVLEADTGNGAP
jgi:hypothetical protein